MKLFLMVLAVLLFLLFERVTFISLIKNDKGREWLRNQKWLHPNWICIYRIPMGVVSCWLWYSVSAEFAVLWCAFWMLTDMTDGTVARGCDLGTPTGEWLDPLSDKCMYIPMLFLFAIHEPSPALPNYKPLAMAPVIIFTIIDIVGQFSRVFTVKKAANSFGKAKTCMVCTLMILVAMKILCHDTFMDLPILKKFNMDYLMWCCVALSFLSFYCKVVPDRWYANSLTALNFICGWAAIYMAWNNHIIQGFVLIFIGQFFDLLDGRCARKFGSTKGGALFDDIADGTSFGLAIGLVLYRTLCEPGAGPCPSAIAIAVIYSVAVIYRLYRFIKTTSDVPKGIFEGIPSPAGAMLAGSSAILFIDTPEVVMIVAILASVLMVSKIHYKHFGQRIWNRLPNAIKLTLFIIIMIYISLVLREKPNIPNPFALLCFSTTMLYLIVGMDLRKKAAKEEEKSEEK